MAPTIILSEQCEREWKKLISVPKRVEVPAKGASVTKSPDRVEVPAKGASFVTGPNRVEVPAKGASVHFL